MTADQINEILNASGVSGLSQAVLDVLTAFDARIQALEHPTETVEAPVVPDSNTVTA